MLVFAPRSLRSCRPKFFVSSNDHTRLLKEAKIHCIARDNGVKQYVLVADGMAKVPQLHLARIYLDGSTNIPNIYGAKVVNRTLGDCSQVCARLLDAALSPCQMQVLTHKPGPPFRSYQNGSFVNKGLGDEAKLYGEKGSLDRIEHKRDTSEFANTCGGSMAVCRLS